MSDALDVWILDPANLTPFYCAALAGALADRGDKVSLFTSQFLHDPGFRFPENIQVDYHYFQRLRGLQTKHEIMRRIWRGVTYPWDHARFFRKAHSRRPDVVHVQWSRLPWFDGRLVRQLRAAEIPVVHTVHDVEPLYVGARGESTLGKVYQTCDALVVHTEANREELLARYPNIEGSRVHVIPHGPVQGDIFPAGASREEARRLLGLPNDAPVALFFGTIKPYKGLDLLVSAFESLSLSLPSAWLVIAGRPGAPSDMPDLTGLDRRGAHYRADIGYIPNEHVWRYYLAADVIVLPYRNITQSGVLLAAMANGLPSIVTSVGGLPEVIRASHSGWVVPSENADALAVALSQALSHPQETLAKGRNGKEYVEKELSWSSIAERTDALYEAVRR